MKNILVIGATGQVARALKDLLGNNSIYLARNDLDLSNPPSIQKTLAEKTSNSLPLAIINAAAYTAVDKAEEEMSLAQAINAESVKEITRFAFESNIPLIHYSTDYVFEGTGEHRRKETEQVNPLGFYGKSKLMGEEFIQSEALLYPDAKWIIFRLCWVYDEVGNNFLNTMLRLGKDREVISVVSDQVGAPTYAHDIAKATIESLDKSMQSDNFPSGIFHLCNAGETTWNSFAEQIFREATEHGESLEIKEVKEILTSAYKTPAPRPLNSRLDCTKLKDVFDISMPLWNDALSRCLENKF